MPIEFEKKYVLSLNTNPNLFSKDKSFTRKEIYQGYLKDGGRLRSIEGHGLIFTYKHTLNNGSVVELEFMIDEEDYDMLWAETENKLYKVRYSAIFGSETWDVDFFYRFHNCDQLYFVMAECEMHGITKPEFMPKAVKDNIIFKPKDNSEYSSKKLSDPNYAKKKLKEISNV